MRNILTILLFSILSLTVSANSDATGWKTYLSYRNTTNVEESNDKIFVVAEGSLYTYGKEDNSIKQYYKSNGLNDNAIALISYNKQAQALIIVYKNWNIDIMDDASVKNIPYLSTSTSLKNKTVNSITIHNEYAYLSTGFGIVVVNMNKDKKEIVDTYNLSENVTSCSILNNQIYAATPSGILTASMNKNLLDKSNWEAFTLPAFPKENVVSSIVTFKGKNYYFVKNKGVYYVDNNTTTSLINNTTINNIKVTGDKLACICTAQIYLFADNKTFDQINNLTVKDISTYQTNQYWIAEGAKGLRSIKRTGANNFEAVNEAIVLDGPYSNSPYKVVCNNDKVYIINGGKTLPGGARFGTFGVVMIYDYDKWSFINPSVSDKFGLWPRDYTSILIDTNNPEEDHLYVSSFGDGVVEFKNRDAIKLYNQSNSTIENAGKNSANYCYVDGLAMDKEGNIWMTNSEVSNAIKIVDKEGKWHSITVDDLKNMFTINDVFITSWNDKWINVPRVNPQIVVIGNSASLDEAPSKSFSSFTDQDGKNFDPSSYTCMAEDKNGYIWVGTSKGAIYFTNPKSAVSSENNIRCMRVKLINEEDGTPFYFLDNVLISAIKVDDGNRKWIGTQGNGIYVLDGENQEVVHQFNTANSPLISDNIYSIDINGKTGEVFIGTDKGLVSYQGEATDGQSSYADIYAYPNPVRPEFMDKVTITGLMDNSNVKITDLSGNIIYQTKSLGGQVIWDCRNRSGRRVATGVYLVLAATENSSESVVTKIAIIK